MKSLNNTKILGVFFFLIFFLGTSIASAAYERYGMGDTITIGEFVYEDDFTPSTVDCTVSVYNPSGATMVNEVVTTKFANGWHYYDYAIPVTGPNGTWPASISCGTLIAGDLVSLDKTFTVGATIENASSSLSSVINSNTNAAILTASTSLASNVNANTNSVVATASSSLFASLPASIWSYSSRTLSSFGTIVADVWTNSVRTLTGAGLSSGSLATADDVTNAANSASSSVVALVNANTNSQTSGITSAVNSNTNATVLAASTSLAANINANTNSATAGITSDVNANTNSVVATASSSLFASLPASIWSYSSRTLSSFGTIVADVWTNSVRTLTGAGLSSGSLATADDVTNAANNASSSVVALVNANTNSQTSGITSAVNNNTNSVVASASSSVVALVNANTNSATAGITSDVNANTAAVVLAASSSLSTQILINRSLISALNNISANDVWAAGSRTLTDYATSSIASSTADETWKRTAAQLTTTGSIGKLLADNIDAAISTRGISNLTASDVWAVGSRTLSDYNTAGISSAAATAVWANASRTLTNYGNNLTAAEVWNALTSSMTSIGSIGKLVGDNLDTTISSRATLVNQTAEWKLTMSDISAVQTGKTYRARLTILNNNSVPTTPFATPTVTLYDADRNVVASGVAMSALGTGIYEYTYSVSSGASQGVWETIITTQVESGKNLTNNDYWLVSGSPAQVIINSVTASTTSDISANVTITNEGLAGYEYQYEWCVVSNINNLCGGGDDSYHATGAKFINPGEDWNTNLTAAVSTGGNYYFKLVVYFGTEKSGSSRTFSLPVTEVPPTTGGGAGGGGSSSGGGGGGGGSSVPTVAPSGPGIGADLSGDRKVNSVDFSILLAYWKTPYPFANKAVDINGDRKVNSVDFSILLSQWGTSGRAL